MAKIDLFASEFAADMLGRRKARVPRRREVKPPPLPKMAPTDRVCVAGLTEHTSRHGRRYLRGRWGGVAVLILEEHAESQPDEADAPRRWQFWVRRDHGGTA